MKAQPRGGAWCGVGMERPKHEVNLGTLYRSAVALGADFIFTIGHRYTRQSSDTIGAAWHVPCFAYKDLDDFQAHRPYSAPLVGVDLVAEAQPLERFAHPRQAMYLLGPEDGTLSQSALDLCQFVVSFDSRYCLNVASAGTVVLYDRHVKLDWKRRPMLEAAS